jgi:glycosyltransferase involved in cell wall biosynthesis
MRVVVVDEEFPFPANSGKRLRTLNLLLPLASRHRITYLAYQNADPGETAEAASFLRAHRIQPVIIPRRLPRKAGLKYYCRLAWNLTSALPYSVQTHNSQALRDAIRSYELNNAVDLWHCEWTPYAHSIAREAKSPWIVMAHNVESLIWHRYTETEKNRLKRWYIQRQCNKFEKFERRIFGLASQTVFVSKADAMLASSQFAARNTCVVDNGVDVQHYKSDGREREPQTILFLGSLDWRPNLDAIDSLLKSIFPTVRTQFPNAKLLLVGRKPPPWLEARVAQIPGVELHANVADVRPFLWRSSMMAVPLRIGGGSRLKILESLAAGCPVVSTRIGAEGLAIEENVHFVQVESAAELGEAIIEHLHNPAEILKMTDRGQQFVTDHHDWSALAERLNAVWLERGIQV